MDNKFVDEALSDLYDEDIKRIGELYSEMLDKFAHKTNNPQNISEMCKWGEDKFRSAGYNVGFDLQGILLGMAPTLVIRGKISHDTDFDHDKKRFEVLRANDRGEKYLGQKGK